MISATAPDPATASHVLRSVCERHCDARLDHEVDREDPRRDRNGVRHVLGMPTAQRSARDSCPRFRSRGCARSAWRRPNHGRSTGGPVDSATVRHRIVRSPSSWTPTRTIWASPRCVMRSRTAGRRRGLMADVNSSGCEGSADEIRAFRTWWIGDAWRRLCSGAAHQREDPSRIWVATGGS